MAPCDSFRHISSRFGDVVEQQQETIMILARSARGNMDAFDHNCDAFLARSGKSPTQGSVTAGKGRRGSIANAYSRG